MLKAFSFIFILSFSLSVFLSGQEIGLPVEFRHLTVEDGLPSNIIYGITQDHEGFMWFATTDGLVRHDGYSMKVFRRGTSDKSLRDNYIYTVFCDSKGRIWVGTNYSGLYLYDPEKQEFSQVNFNFFDSINFESNRIRKIKEDIFGNLWLCSPSNGIIRFNPDTQEDFLFQHNPENHNSLPSNNVLDIDFDDLGNPWIITSNKGLSYLNLETERFTHFHHDPTDKKSLPSNIGYSVYWANNGVYFGTQDGLFKLRLSDSTFIKYSDKETFQILKSSANKYYMCTNEGLIIIDEIGRFHSLVTKSAKTDDLSSNNTYCVFEDQAGVMWIGTRDGGLNIKYPRRKNFQSFHHDPYNENSISSNTIRGFSEDNEGNIWISTVKNGVNVYDKQNEKFHNLSISTFNGIKIENQSFTKLLHDKAGNLWAGTWGKGVYFVDNITKQVAVITNSSENTNSLQDNIVLDIFEDSQGNIWFGTETGFDVYSPKLNKFRHFKSIPGANNTITPLAIQSNCIIEDINGNFWVGTYGGLNFMKRKNTHPDIFYDDFDIQKITTESDENIRLSENRIISMYYETKRYPDKILIGTYGGGLQVVHFENDGPELTNRYNTENGLSNNIVYGILTDESGNIWLSTNNGLTKFDSELFKFKSYGVNDGLQGPQFYWGASFKASDGALYFGGINGFNKFYSDSIKDDTYLPPVVLTDFRIFNKSINVGDTINGKVILKKSINYQDEITLSVNENVFSIEFAGLHYAFPKDNIYEYMLENFDNDFIPVKFDQRLITYTNLDPGSYIFKVRAGNFNGKWNHDVKSIKITILPPFYKTTWFRILAIMSIATLLIISFYIRVASINRQRVLLKRLVNEKTTKLNTTNQKLISQAKELNDKNALLIERQRKVEEQAKELHLQAKILQTTNNELEQSNASKDKFFSILSHDLKNPFNFIMGSSEILFKRYDNLSDEKKKAYAKKIFNSSKNTFRLLENLLNWSRAQSKQISPQLIPLMIFDVIDQNILVVKEKLKEKEINLQKEIDQSLLIKADINMINLIVQNLLTNAIKFTPRKGDIKIKAEQSDGMVFIHFIDNGVGMKPDTLEELFKIDNTSSKPGTEGESGTGLGLILTEEFVKANDGSISIDSEPEKGTTVTITFPDGKVFL